MSKQFKSLILYPTIFVVVLLGALTANNSYLAFLIFIFLIFEQIYSWNKSLNSNQNYEFRIFFTEQYLNIVYLLIIFPLYLISTFLWDQINFWILFGYGLNFIIFRLVADVGTDQLSKTNYSKSKDINSSLDLWKSNKKRLSSILLSASDESLKEQIKDKLNFSSFLNTEDAASLIKKAENSKGQDLDEILRLIDKSM
tara:strand:+ start:726 stop:1319 length:594 start_codon:yes stop_codon:yes gene_type:complete